MREKLIELVHNARINALWHNAPNQSEYMTDMLINDGVTIPVRCKDCKWRDYHENNGFYLCYDNSRYVELDGFCAWGERKDNG